MANGSRARFGCLCVAGIYQVPSVFSKIALGLFGALMFLFPVFAWMLGIGKDNESATLNLELVIDMIVRHRSPGPLEYWQYADIFIQASAHLKNPRPPR